MKRLELDWTVKTGNNWKEQERTGKSRKELERAGKNWKEQERTGKNWKEQERTGKNRTGLEDSKQMEQVLDLYVRTGFYL